MTILTPQLKPNALQKIESDFGSTIASFIWKNVLQHQLWVNRSIPLGSILSFYGSQLLARTDLIDELIPQPDSSFWQWCDGSIINNANSPLFGEATPDFREKFLKGYPILGLIGGQSTVNLSHNHGGTTSSRSDGSTQIIADVGNDPIRAGAEHAHSISYDWSANESFIPPYSEVQYYLRIDGGAGSTIPSLDNFLSTTFGSLINDQMAEYAKILSNEMATMIYYNSFLLDSLIPIASIIPIMTNIIGVPGPDLNIFQECDGSEITNENSPLRSIGGSQRFVPNLLDHYIRIPSSFGLSGNFGGLNDSNQFKHNHGGQTSGHPNPEGGDPSNSLHMAEPWHVHQVFNDLINPINIEPPFYTVKFFMRIQ